MLESYELSYVQQERVRRMVYVSVFLEIDSNRQKVLLELPIYICRYSQSQRMKNRVCSFRESQQLSGRVVLFQMAVLKEISSIFLHQQGTPHSRPGCQCGMFLEHQRSFQISLIPPASRMLAEYQKVKILTRPITVVTPRLCLYRPLSMLTWSQPAAESPRSGK